MPTKETETRRDPFEIFNIQSVVEHQKVEGGCREYSLGLHFCLETYDTHLEGRT